MDGLKLRDRDAILTCEELIFRVLGYIHPPAGYICDLEYAPSEIFRSDNPKAFRSDGRRVFYKFFGDEGWRFILEKYPQYMLDYEPLGRKVVGVRRESIVEVRRPEERLRQIIESHRNDELIRALREVLRIFIEGQGLSMEGFGVFGSLLHGFYNPRFSDIDIVVYGRSNLERVRQVLCDFYRDRSSFFTNEFADNSPVKGKVWRFKNLSPEDFVWHQRRKMIYALFHDGFSGRLIKVEFEPVKAWHEISNKYWEINRIVWRGWIKAIVRVTSDEEAPFMPSIYYVEPIEIIDGPKADSILRVVSYLEEFRMQCWRDEIAYVEGNLEEVETKGGNFHQITLTYGPRYYEQTLKIMRK
ncbi:MAG: nucleotidyltransferase domain-containing protein [Candidatus Bathyarchaeota archaeon]|nr:nucleotidyltransferase domain-containing protein [Candidatus Bathyarchaeota archaeon]